MAAARTVTPVTIFVTVLLLRDLDCGSIGRCARAGQRRYGGRRSRTEGAEDNGSAETTGPKGGTRHARHQNSPSLIAVIEIGSLASGRLPTNSGH
jgi:hypothetical protein